jgi:hypothetical protein
MDRRLAADEWSALSSVERISFCELMANEAVKMSKGCPPGVVQVCNRLENEWRLLAQELAKEKAPDSP